MNPNVSFRRAGRYLFEGTVSNAYTHAHQWVELTVSQTPTAIAITPYPD